MKESIDILIVEDEPLNADRAARLLTEIRKDIKVVGVVPSIKRTVDWFLDHKTPDLILMDVKLADGLSFDAFEQADIKSPVIFTTAYDEYAIKAFKYNSVDYLLKPIDKDELASAVYKFEHSIQRTPLEKSAIDRLVAQLRPKKYRNRFLIPHRDRYEKVEVDDIAYFHSSQNICYVHLGTGVKMSIPHTLESLEKELDPGIFFRVNRQYIVHVDSIDSIHEHFNGKLKLILQDNEKTAILISRIKAPLFKEWLGY